MVHMKVGRELGRGKTKTIYQHPSDPKLVILHFRDDLTAGDGAKHDLLPGKGAINWETSSTCFKVLEANGIRTHYVSSPESCYMVVKKAKMFPIEVVARRIAYGSLCKRLPFKSGERLPFILMETFYKNDAYHDPLLNSDHLIALDIAGGEEIEIIKKIGRRAFEILEKQFAKQNVTLVDLKIEVGRVDDELVLADELTNDSWRIWPRQKEELMLDKQKYRRGDTLEEVKRGYEQALDIVRKFVI